MINPFLEINWKPDRKAILDFGKALIIGGAVLLTIASGYRIFIASKPVLFTLQMIFSAIMIVGFTAYLFPEFAKPLYWIWFFFGACVGIVLANLVFLLFYYLFFTPIALLVRLRGRDPLQLRPPDRPSMWIDHGRINDLKRYFRQY